jgi:hypothetical protein
MNNMNTNLVEKLFEKKLYIGRMVSGSKSGYSSQYPNNFVVFNANIIIPNEGKVWYGDLDLTKDGNILKEVANECNTAIYVLREMDARFENENSNTESLIKKAVWNTSEEIPTI